ncbi:MAG: hypothetical protein ACJ77K_18405 [Bacteroidia bacterium]
MNTLYLIITLFALGALVGMYLLALVLQKKETPKFVAFIHGAFVVAALILLITYSLQNPGLREAIVLFVIAAIGGLVLIIRDVTAKPIPRWLAVVHGLIAVSGFIFLLCAAFAK